MKKFDIHWFSCSPITHNLLIFTPGKVSSLYKGAVIKLPFLSKPHHLTVAGVSCCHSTCLLSPKYLLKVRFASLFLKILCTNSPCSSQIAKILLYTIVRGKWPNHSSLHNLALIHESLMACRPVVKIIRSVNEDKQSMLGQGINWVAHGTQFYTSSGIGYPISGGE